MLKFWVSFYGRFGLSRYQWHEIGIIVSIRCVFCKTLELWFPIMGIVIFEVFGLERIVRFPDIPAGDIYLCI